MKTTEDEKEKIADYLFSKQLTVAILDKEIEKVVPELGVFLTKGVPGLKVVTAKNIALFVKEIHNRMKPVVVEPEAEGPLSLPVCCSPSKPQITQQVHWQRDAAYISPAMGLIANKGCVAVPIPEDYLLFSLMNEVQYHIVIGHCSSIYPTLDEWLNAADLKEGIGFTLVSGPSRTADIEKKIVLGIQGPGTVHLLLKTTPHWRSGEQEKA